MTWPANLTETHVPFNIADKQKAARGGLSFTCQGASLALTRLEARVGLADHEYLAATADDLAVAVPRLGGFERG
jgi:hypothetical protein